MKITVFLGAPGSGKGTQAKRLSQFHGFRHFSTGDMLRTAIQAGTAVGKKAKEFMDKGELVPDQIMIEAIETALRGLSPNTKVILDGFPRTVPQAEALDESEATQVNSAVFFKVPENHLITRLTGRRICENCGEPYHVVNIPPKVDGKCDRCGGKLIQRADDSEAVVRRRLEIFNSQNGQLLQYYQDEDKLEQIDGDQPVDKLQKNLLDLLS